MRLSLRRLATHWRLKLASLALALLLWVVVSAEQQTTQWIPVRVEPVLRDPDFVLTGTPDPPSVRVRFSGPGRELWELALQRPTLVLRVASVGAARSFALDPGMVELPDRFRSVQARDVRPAVVRLELEPVATRLLPVRARLAAGALRGSLLDDSLHVSPAEVRVSGPESLLEGLEALSTRPVTPPAGESAFSLRVALDTSGLRGVSLSRAEVRVTGRLRRASERVLTTVAVLAPGGMRAVPGEVVVRLRAPAADAATLATLVPEAVAGDDSLPRPLPAAGAEVPVRLRGIPAGVSAVAVPDRVRLIPHRSGADLPAPLPPPSANPPPPPSTP